MNVQTILQVASFHYRENNSQKCLRPCHALNYLYANILAYTHKRATSMKPKQGINTTFTYKLIVRL